ncbi:MULTISPECIES: hypothetical protein [Cysteiniphilum]|uniref:Uncharacterized protein n=1 Tax=Cysteiniphilum litorale TaxID=2056700 RepID=A0A8J2Z3D7_9GAMM|nr:MULTISPECIES: hypothetical protein [Cysteiniphilum]GGF93518.1 hypothetical protein GCM10010995_08330 [Cysteiniphilum litorale]
MITLSNLLNKMLVENGVICIENGHEKAFDKLNRKAVLLNLLITQAEDLYHYVFGESIVDINEESYDLIQLLFIFDQALSLCDENILAVDNVLGGVYESAANK